MSEQWIRLGELASARSGDKGNHANIGVVAKSDVAYEILRETLSADRMQAFLSPLHPTRVERFELPKVGAFNFVLYDILAGGASQSLRLDTQGKLLGAAVTELRLPLDAAQRERLHAGDQPPTESE